MLLKLAGGNLLRTSLGGVGGRSGPGGDPEPPHGDGGPGAPEPRSSAVPLGQLTPPHKNRKKVSQSRCGAADGAVMDPDKAVNRGRGPTSKGLDGDADICDSKINVVLPPSSSSSSIFTPWRCEGAPLSDIYEALE